MADDLTRADRLTADRDRLEAAISVAEPRELPALVREHRAVLAELDKLAKPQEGSTRDQLAAKRQARQARTSGPAASEV